MLHHALLLCSFLGQAPEPLPLAFHLKMEPNELRDLTNRASITPSLAPQGLKGMVVVRGSGAASLSETAGISFVKNGQQNTNVSFLSFTGIGTAQLFDITGPGEVAFTWTSAYSFTDRKNLVQTTGSRFIHRAAFAAHSDAGAQASIFVTVQDGYLAFVYRVGTVSQYYFVPRGTEDALFDKGKAIQVSIKWDGLGKASLSFNGTKVSDLTYTRVPPTWSNSSFLIIGSTGDYTGGFYASDEPIKDFRVFSRGPLVDKEPPTVRSVSHYDGQTISGVTRLKLIAQDNVRVKAISLVIDGRPAASTSSYPFDLLVDTRSLPDGEHTIDLVAMDMAGNQAVQHLTLRTANTRPTDSEDTESPDPIIDLRTVGRNPNTVTLSWTEAADNVGVTEFTLYRDGVIVANVQANQPGESLSYVFVDKDLEAAKMYEYSIESRDAAGNRSWRSSPLAVSTPSRDGQQLLVGPHGQFATPCKAFLAAKDWDTIQIDAAGSYDGDVCAISANHLLIQGINGRPRIDAQGMNAQGKGIWVISGADTTIENVELSGALVPDRNGAAIRAQGLGLTLRHLYLHHNENGVLANNGVGGDINIEYCEFAFNGSGTGQTHNLYIGDVDRLVFRFNYSHHSNIGHLLKSRAKTNWILYNRLTDESGTASYEIDLPNGGTSYVVGNLIQQSSTSANPLMIAFGAEKILPGYGSQLFVTSNVFVNLMEKKYDRIVFLASDGDATLRNNLLIGVPGILPASSNNHQDRNTTAEQGIFVDLSEFDFRFKEGIPNPLLSPTENEPPELAPTFAYYHPTSGVTLDGTFPTSRPFGTGTGTRSRRGSRK